MTASPAPGKARGALRAWIALSLSLAVAAPGAAQVRGEQGGAAEESLWQITLRDGTIVWNLHLERLERDTLVFREDSAQVRYPLARVDELRLVRPGPHEIGPVAAGGRYDGAPNGASDLVYPLTLLSLAERRQVIERILHVPAAAPP